MRISSAAININIEIVLGFWNTLQVPSANRKSENNVKEIKNATLKKEKQDC